MNLLALDTATEACSVALSIDGQVIERYTTEPRVHAARVLGMIHECLAESRIPLSDLQVIAFGRGPGSFTGVRIATGVVQGLAFGLQCPVIPVSTLAGFAATARRLHDLRRIAVCLDARMGECYWGTFEVSVSGIATPAGAERLAVPADLPLPDGDDWLAVGSGWDTYPELASRMGSRVARVEADLLPAASDLIATAVAAYAAGATVAAEQALPVYLRDRVAWRS